jgi:tRNA A-37 threonylcarbamoyl transferase component Bud32
MYKVIKQITRRWHEAPLFQQPEMNQNTYSSIIIKKCWNRFVAFDQSWGMPSLQQLLNDPDSFMKTGQILKAGNTATVAKVNIASQTLVIKRYNIKSVRHALRRCLRHSRAMVSWKNAHLLQRLGIDTPRPLAVVEERWGPLRKQAYLITGYLSGDTIQDVFNDQSNGRNCMADNIAQLIALIEHLAAVQISHGDFKATNFISSSGRLYIVDLDGMRAHRSIYIFRRSFRRDLLRLQRNWPQTSPIYKLITPHIEQILSRLECLPDDKNIAR